MSAQIIRHEPALRNHNALLNASLLYVKRCVACGLVTPKDAEAALVWASNANTGALRAWLENLLASRDARSAAN